jgi:hypothetical protein
MRWGGIVATLVLAILVVRFLWHLAAMVQKGRTV